MKKIPLTQGMVALVDAEDYEGLMQWKWQAKKPNCTRNRAWYAIRNKRGQDREQVTIWMHRAILNTPLGYETDHINGNGLDNRRENLRVATKAQNSWHRSIYKNNTSGFKGVSWHKGIEKWVAYIRFNTKRINLGYFKDKREAAKAYNEAAIKYHGEFAFLNQVSPYA